MDRGQEAAAAPAEAGILRITAVSADGSHNPQIFRMRTSQPLARLAKTYATFRGLGVGASARLRMWAEGNGVLDPAATAGSCGLVDGSFVTFSGGEPPAGAPPAGAPTGEAAGEAVGHEEPPSCQAQREDEAVPPESAVAAVAAVADGQQAAPAEAKQQERKPRRQLKMRLSSSQTRKLSSSQTRSVQKKPPPAIFCFIQKHRAAIQAEPDVKSRADIFKRGAELYKALPEEERAQWQAEYDGKKRAFDEWAATDAGRLAKASRAPKKAAGKRKGKTCAAEDVASGPAAGWKVTVWLEQVAQGGSQKFNNAICWKIASPSGGTYDDFKALEGAVDGDVCRQLCNEVKPGLLRNIWNLQPVAAKSSETAPRGRPPKRAAPGAADSVGQPSLGQSGKTPQKKARQDSGDCTSIVTPSKQALGSRPGRVMATQAFRPKEASAPQGLWTCACEAHLRRHPRCVYNSEMQPFVIHLRDRLTLGRGETCDIVLDSKLMPAMISRSHAVVEREGGRFTLTDQRSTNGVLVNGKGAQGTQVLNSGDVVTFGIPTENPEFDYIFETRAA